MKHTKKTFSQRLGIMLFLILVFLPILGGVMYALLQSVGMSGGIQKGFTWQYWQQALQNQELYIALVYSFVIAWLVLFFSLVFAFLMVWFFFKNLQSTWGYYVPYFPLAIPVMVAGFFSFYMLSGAGWVARIFFHLGWIGSPEQFPHIIQDKYAIGIILTHSLLSSPFFTLLLLNVFQSEKLADLLRLAENLGANAHQRFWKVLLPVLWRRIKALVVLYLIFLIGTYEIPLLLGSSSPRVISVLIVDKLQRFDLNEIPLAYIYALVYSFFAWVLLWLNRLEN